jgi:anti-sigma regulatory factor (Ser/Thr protein kinase)
VADLPGPGADPPASALRHAGAFYPSPRALVSRIAPMVRADLDRGVPVALAVAPRTRDALGEALGGLDAVAVLDHPDSPAGRSGQTMAVRRAAQLRELAGGNRPVTLIAEHLDRFDGPDGRFWVELEAASNVAMAGTAVQMRCFYPELPLHRAVRDGALRTHPTLLDDRGARHNPDYRPPREVLAELPVPPPVLLGPPDLRLDLECMALTGVRARLEAELLAAGYRRARTEDVVFALNEIATNALLHGAAPAEVHVWTVPGAVVVEVHDSGRLTDPLPGIAPPAPGQRSGWGVWIARQTCEAVHLWSDPAGTHVRLHV